MSGKYSSHVTSTEVSDKQDDADIEVFESEYRTYREAEAAENREEIQNDDNQDWKVPSKLNLELTNSKAVSYTHLDVYKRQG